PPVAEERDQVLAGDVEIDLAPCGPHPFALQDAMEVAAWFAALRGREDVQVLRIEVVAGGQHVEKGDPVEPVEVALEGGGNGLIVERPLEQLLLERGEALRLVVAPFRP